mgnify:CR=1 FL=1
MIGHRPDRGAWEYPPTKHPPTMVLSIESSCDETSAAVVQNGRVLSNNVASQVRLHAEYGGVVLVEWGDVVEGIFGDHLTVHLDPDPDDETDELALDRARLIEIAGTGSSWAGRWDALRNRLTGYTC